MKNKNFDFISSKFDDENINAPESLSEENVKARLEKGTSTNNIIKFKPNNKRFVKSAVSIAAAIALVVVSISAVNYFGSRVTNNDDITSSNEDIIYFSSRDEIDELMKERLDDEKSGSGFIVKNFKKSAEEAEIAEDGATGKMNYGEDTVASSGVSHSDTYKQVDAVDEADIVKTDGEYIYYLSNGEREIVIVSAKDGKTKNASKIKIDDDSEPRELFVKDNTLVVITSGTRYIDKKNYEYKTITNVKAYDIKDRRNPKEKYSYSQSGYYDSSRMIGDCVYIVSNESNFYYIKNHIYPCATDKDGKFSELPPQNVCAIKDGKGGNYTVIGALDVSNGRKAKKTKAVIGATDKIYCSENNLYITGVNYDFNSYTFNSECTIVKISLEKTNINIKATGRVKGNVNDQYSMDEKDGYFRIATTKQTQKGNDINVLYVLDEKLNEVGRVNSFAKNEHIEAVKYIGDMAYVITYEQTDPLFIIDLKDPENPDILGEVKISGFSTMLVPIDEKTLLGIGYSTEENEFGEATNGLKLALFDISNPATPKVIGEKEFEGVDSEVQNEPKALVVNSEKKYFAIPATFDDYESQGALVFTANNGKINVLKKFVSDRLIESDRCLYIDDFIYAIDTYEEIIDSFTLD